MTQVAQLRTLSVSAESGPSERAEEIAGILQSDGALIVENLLSPQEVAAVRDETRPYMEATRTGKDEFTGKLTTRTGALVARSGACRERVMQPEILAGARAFLAPYCARIQLHLTQIIRLMPGQPAQQIHRDRWAWGTHLKGVEPQFNTIWALTDFTLENGATQVVPGSVDWPDERRPEADEIAYAEMKAGSVLIYSGSVFHGGGANQSQSDRIGLNITYTLGWLRQEENQYLSCPPELARNMSPDLQDLLGYTLGSYALGYYTPPVGPGEGPEVVGPEYALGRVSSGEGLGSEELLKEVSRETSPVE